MVDPVNIGVSVVDGISDIILVVSAFVTSKVVVTVFVTTSEVEEPIADVEAVNKTEKIVVN